MTTSEWSATDLAAAKANRHQWTESLSKVGAAMREAFGADTFVTVAAYPPTGA